MNLAKILVGVDFSPESLRAVEHAMSVARHRGGTIVLAHVAAIPPPRNVAGNDGWAALLRENLAADRVALADLRERIAGQGVDISQVVHDGFADTALAELAREVGAGLIVVGTHGRTGVKRWMLGSVAEKTVRLADVSVLVARGEAPPGGYRRIVVGTDYSELAWRALDRAFELAAPDADVRVVHAWQAPYVEYDLSGDVLAKARESAEAEALAHRERLRDTRRPPGVSLHLELDDGAPFEALDRRSVDAELVVVGSHGRRGLRRFVLGSVAEATVRYARCAVLVAR
jgi:nucleotide-binding universal stress UspA family protein